VHSRAKPLFFSFFTDRAAQVGSSYLIISRKNEASPPRRRERKERLVSFFLGALGVSAVETAPFLMQIGKLDRCYNRFLFVSLRLTR
jgi:hypothetical protein